MQIDFSASAVLVERCGACFDGTNQSEIPVGVFQSCSDGCIAFLAKKKKI
jgi:hypothetical protein